MTRDINDIICITIVMQVITVIITTKTAALMIGDRDFHVHAPPRRGEKDGWIRR